MSSPHPPCHPREGGDLVLSVLIGFIVYKGEEKLFICYNILKVCKKNQIPALAGNDKKGVWE